LLKLFPGDQLQGRSFLDGAMRVEAARTGGRIPQA
jgi:hypothetical protein